MQGYDLSQLSILLVEKEINMRRLYRSVLRALGIRNVLVEGNVDQAYESVKNMKPDIMITDWTPDFDGLALTKRLRHERSAIKVIPIVIMSAYSEVTRIEMARDTGANQFLVKPFTAAGLYERIRATIEDEVRFVSVKKYKGPCRRRRVIELKGEDRRASA